MTYSKHVKAALFLLLITITALSGCIGTYSKSIAIRQEIKDIRLPLGETMTIELEIDPSDVELSSQADDPSITAVTVQEHELSFAAIGVGTTTVNVVARRQGYKDSVLSYNVSVFEIGTPAILAVTLSPADPITGSEKIVTVDVTTTNVEDGTAIEAEFLDAEGDPLDPAITAFTIIQSNQAKLTLNLPTHLDGSYLVRVAAQGILPRSVEYTYSNLSLPTHETQAPSLWDTWAAALHTESDYLAGEPIAVVMALTQGDQPAPDGIYAVTISSDLDGILLEEENCSFAEGKAELLLTTTPSTAGHHVLTVDVEGSSYSFDLYLLPAQPAGLRLVAFGDHGTANAPILGPPTVVLVDVFGNVIREGGQTITAAVPGGFASGTESVLTDADGQAEFLDLILQEGEYYLTFSHNDLELMAPLLVVGYVGTGEEHFPYLIHNLHGLNGIRTDPTAHYQLANDIEAGATAEIDSPYGNDGDGWEPIRDFEGSLTGGHAGGIYTIHDLFIHRPDSSQVGLFANIAPNGTVIDLQLQSAKISGGNSVGALAGRNDGQIIGCTVLEAEVLGRVDVGGLVGTNTGSITRCSATGNTTALGLTLSSYSGGLVGNNRGTISRSYARGSVTGFTVGGLAGHNQNHSNGVIQESYAAVSLSGAGNRGGLTGLNLGSVSTSYFDQNLAATTFGAGLSRSTFDMQQTSTYAGWDFTNVWSIDSSINGGYPSLRP